MIKQRQRKLFTFRDSWIYALILAISVACLVGVFFSDNTPEAKVISCVVTLTFWAMVFRRYQTRWEYLKQIIGNASGIDILLDASAKMLIEKKESVDQLLAEIDKVISEAKGFMNIWAVTNGYDRINFEGALMVVIPGPYFYFSGESSMKIAGLCMGDFLKVTFDSTNQERFLLIIRHEVGHLALLRMGIEGGYAGNKHHDLFNKMNYGA